MKRRLALLTVFGLLWMWGASGYIPQCGAAESGADAETAEVAEAAAVTETAAVVETVAATETAAVAETVAATETAAVVETAVVAETAAATKTAAVAETAAVTETLVPVETAVVAKAAAAAETAADNSEAGSVEIVKERGLLNWTQSYVESSGVGVVPKGMKGAQAKAMARRGAIVDLQRNLLEFMGGVQIDGRTTLDNFMADDLVRQEVHGIIQGVEVLGGEWDGESYTVSGRIRLKQIRQVVVTAPVLQQQIVIVEAPAPAPKRSGGTRYTGLVIDARHLSLLPSMTFNVLDENGKAVYGMNFVNQESYLQSGLCAYYNNIGYAKAEGQVASNPIVAKAVRLAGGNVDIVISGSDASKVRGSSFDFRRECRVIVVCK
jgi:hypothetical protein